MMPYPYILLLIGLILIFLEFYTPGGVLAIVGAIFWLSAITTYVTSNHSVIESCLFVALAVAGLAFVFWFALRRIRKTGDKNTLYLSKDQMGYQAATFDTSLIGKEGVALSDFGPSGYVLIDGKRFAAICRGSYLDKGAKVVVIGGEVDYLIVKPIVSNS